MALGTPPRKKAPLGVFAMLFALVISAFLGAAAGLVWQSQDWFDEEADEEVVTANQAPS